MFVEGETLVAKFAMDKVNFSRREGRERDGGAQVLRDLSAPFETVILRSLFSSRH
jgi:hypothetical protein